jgi:hypothetical protein
VNGEFVIAPPSLLASVSVLKPADTGVYVNVFAELLLDQESELGVNVPPAPPSENVIVSDGMLAAGVTVKFVLAAPVLPLDGPVSV